MRKLILAAILAATMALSLATTAGAGVLPPCCWSTGNAQPCV